VVDAVREYVEGERRSNPHAGSRFLLLTQRAGRMDRDTVNKLLRKHGAIVGVVMKPHKFRHTFCSRLVRRGVPLTTVARLAGHASVQTTAKFYVNTSRQEKVEAVNLL
jgi:site-specific recombinase XerD